MAARASRTPLIRAEEFGSGELSVAWMEQKETSEVEGDPELMIPVLIPQLGSSVRYASWAEPHKTFGLAHPEPQSDPPPAAQFVPRKGSMVSHEQAPYWSQSFGM